MIASKSFNNRTDAKFPCLKLIILHVWLWHDSIHRVRPLPSSIFEGKTNSRKFNAVSFFEGGGKIEIKTLRNKLDIEKELIHRSLFGGLLFLETGSLSLAIMNTKTARKSSENETQIVSLLSTLELNWRERPVLRLVSQLCDVSHISKKNPQLTYCKYCFERPALPKGGSEGQVG